MALDATKVIIGLADQSKTTGALRRGPVINNIPDTFAEALAAIAGFESSGYFDEEGASLSTDISTNDLKEWNGATVRKLIENFDGNVSGTLLQADYEGWVQLLGADNVELTEATTEHGEQLHIKLGAHLGAPQAWALCMKDGDSRMIVLIPNGQVANGVELTFQAGDAIKLPLEISANDDGTGENIHIYTDDGNKLSVTASTDLSALAIGSCTLSPTFAPGTTEYATTTAESADAVSATASAASATVDITVNGNSLTSGDEATWAVGANAVRVVVTNGGHSQTYTVTVNKSE